MLTTMMWVVPESPWFLGNTPRVPTTLRFSKYTRRWHVRRCPRIGKDEDSEKYFGKLFPGGRFCPRTARKYRLATPSACSSVKRLDFSHDGPTTGTKLETVDTAKESLQQPRAPLLSGTGNAR